MPPGPYEGWRVKLSEGSSQAVVIMYRSGKLVLSGHAPAFDQAAAIVEAVGKPAAKKQAVARPTTSEPAAAPPETEAHIGTDEAGKGDFFGPLVTAGVFVDERGAKLLYIRSQYEHMSIVTSGKVIPVLLHLTPLSVVSVPVNVSPHLNNTCLPLPK